MKRKLPRYALATGIIILLALGLLHLRGELILRKFAKLETTYDGHGLDPEFYSPRWVPRSVDPWLDQAIGKMFPDGRQAFDVRNRVRLLMGAPVPTIRLTGVRSLGPGFKEALTQFSSATSIDVWFSTKGAALTEQDALQVCEALRQMPALESVDLYGDSFTHNALTALAGHEKISSMRVPARTVTRACIPIFLSLPSLDTLLLMGGGGDAPSSVKDEVEVIAKALPSRVTVMGR